MSVRLQDRNLIVNYIQVYLHDYFGMSLNKVTQKRRRAVKDEYEISQSQPVKVNGVYTEETYLSVSLFMSYNYPGEKFPVRWDLKEGSERTWIQTPFDYEKLTKTMTDLVNSKFAKGKSFTEEDYRSFLDNQVKEGQDVNDYLSDYDQLSRYFEDGDVYSALVSKQLEKPDSSGHREFTREDANKSLIVFLTHNLEASQISREVLSLDDRILSYFFEEVVTPLSESDEILRIQKIMYPSGIDYTRAGIYDDIMTEDVKKYQQDFLDKHLNKGTDSSEIVLPEGFEGFKVTGYVDPWTEVVLKGGVD